MDELKRCLREMRGARQRLYDTEAVPLLAATANRAMTPDELRQSAEVEARLRQIDDQIRKLEGQIDTEEQRAALGLDGPHGGGWGDGGEFAEQMRDLIEGRRSQPVELVVPMTRGAVSVQGGMRVRALTTADPGAAVLGTSVFGQLVQGMQDGSGLLKLATIVATDTGEPLIVPRGAVGTAALTADGAPIEGTDPALTGTTLRAYKVAQLVEINREFLDDTGNLFGGYIAQQAGVALGLKMGALLVSGTGNANGQPTGLLTTATVGVTGPTGTATSFGTQATAGQGTDLINSLFASVAEPYAASPKAAFVGRNATITALKNLKTSTGDPVGSAFVASGAGAPFVPDAFMPVPAANALSLAFGDWRMLWVRMVGGVRFERSDHAKFSDDKVLFKAVARFDGALVDTAAVKLFKHSAS